MSSNPVKDAESSMNDASNNGGPKVPPAPKGVATKVRLAHLQEMTRAGRRLVMVTAYDSCFGALADEAGVDIILVGDSVGNVMHGFDSTLPVTMDLMVVHTAAVTRGGRRAFVVADMPFASYTISTDDAVRNATRLLAEGGAEAVKLECSGRRSMEAVAAILDAGIPVMGHLGLLPQSVHAQSGYRRQKVTKATHAMALELEKLGAFAVVLEGMADDDARAISDELQIPTLGIGAGPGCDGQVLVMHDMLGLTKNPPPFARRYVDLRNGALRAFRKYARDVREGLFPEEKE